MHTRFPLSLLMRIEKLSPMLWLACAMAFVCGENTQTSSQFMRYVETGRFSGRLETAITSYKRADGVQVDLVSVIHSGELEYYKRLQTILESYDVLLYEGMASGNKRNGKNGKEETSPPREGILFLIEDWCVQRMLEMMHAIEGHILTHILGLAEQGDGIDYSPTNFLRADMDLETFKRRVAEKGEFWLELGMMPDWLLDYAGRKLEELQTLAWRDITDFTWLLLRDWRRAIKYLAVREAGELLKVGFSDVGVETVVIHERNAIAFRALLDQLQRGVKHVGIFYGAAHMQDLEKRLLRSGFQKMQHAWYAAWRAESRPGKIE